MELHSFSLQPPSFLVHLVSQHPLHPTVFPPSDLLLLKSYQLCDPYFLVSLSCPSSRTSTAWRCRPMTSCWPRAPRTAQPSCGRWRGRGMWACWGCFGGTGAASGPSASLPSTRCWPRPPLTAPPSCGACRTSAASRWDFTEGHLSHSMICEAVC